LALPVLVRLRFEIHADPAKQTTIDREVLMTTKEVDKYLSELELINHELGRQKGFCEGVPRAVLAVYRIRFGAPPAELVAAVERAGDHAELQRLLEIVATRTAEDIAAALRSKPQARSAARVKVSRGGASPRRAAATR
jgi:hypothetical protein